MVKLQYALYRQLETILQSKTDSELLILGDFIDDLSTNISFWIPKVVTRIALTLHLW